MTHDRTRTRAAFKASRAFLPALLVTLAACSESSGGGGGSGLPVGSIQNNSATDLRFLVEANQGGSASSLVITGVFWGRLVDIYDRDPVTGSRTLLFTDFLIGKDISSDGTNYLLERNPVTEKEFLTILHKEGSAQFESLLLQAEENLQVFLDKGLAPTELPPFTAVPRNAAMVVVFNDLLEDGGNPGDVGYPGRVTRDNIRALVGNPPDIPFEARVLPDPNHGDIVGGTFHSTRVLVDFTVSSLESQLTGLPINSVGLPEAATTLQVNAAIRIPTKTNLSAGQPTVLTNLTDHPLSLTNNGPTEPGSPTKDVVRGFRSSGKTSITGDPDNGFLPDSIPPDVIGSQGVVLETVSPGASPDQFIVSYRFNTAQCSSRPRIGDILELPNHLAQVTQNGNPPSGGVATDVHVGLLVGDPSTFGPFVAIYRTSWDPTSGSLPDCFARFSPEAGQLPDKHVATNAAVILSFSEPMDPGTVEAFDSFLLSYENPPNPNPLFKNVIGQITPSLDLRSFSFEPSVPLRHTVGVEEKYLVDLVDGDEGVTDLAGNPLHHKLPQIDFTLEPTQQTRVSSGVSLKFDGNDEDGNGFPEVRGQLLFDAQRRLIKPRSVTRFSLVADTSVPIVGAMVPFTGPVQTPLSNLGSKMMTVYRYHDFSLGLLEDADHNLDVEGLAWAPFDTGLQIDNFPLFQMSVTHCKYLPDESVAPGSLLPNFTGSGIVTTFANNIADTETLQVVHPKQSGYQVLPSDVYFAPTGTLLAPWPWNRNQPLSQFTYFTWRDTGKLAVGGPNGNGADTQRFFDITGLGKVTFYFPGQVPTIGLPLLVEFRTYPSNLAFGLNGFKVAIAINSSAQPNFRVFSTGGLPSTGPPKIVDPDNNVTANGGISPATGQPTPAQDNVFYYGQGSFVTRLSRGHTIWFDTGANHKYAPVVVEPGASTQPSGTQVVLAFRGASNLAPVNAAQNPTPYASANNLSPYGDPWTAAQLGSLLLNTNNGFSPSYVGGTSATDKKWYSDPAAVNNARFIQLRITFLCNPETSLFPEVSALGIPFFQ